MPLINGLRPEKWTIDEELELLKLWKSEGFNWPGISVKMVKAYPKRRIEEFSPKACKENFEKIIHSPAPNQIIIPSKPMGFSLKSLVDTWIEHLIKEGKKECERLMEEYLVGIRSSYALIDRAISDDPPMNTDQLEALLEQLRSQDAQKNDNGEAIVKMYIKRLEAVEEERKRNGKPLPEHCPFIIPPTKIAEVPPQGIETAFRTPEVSPINSPIRQVVSSPPNDQPIADAPVPKEDDIEMAGSNVKLPTSSETPIREKSVVEDDSVVPVHPQSIVEDDIVVPIVPVKSSQSSLKRKRSKNSSTSSKRTTGRRVRFEDDDYDDVTPEELSRLEQEELSRTKINLMSKWQIAANHRHASIFMNPVTERDAPGYSEAIKNKMDLSTLKREIETGSIRTFEQFKSKLMLIFANAVMFNSIDSQIYRYCQEMQRDIIADYNNMNYGNKKRQTRRSKIGL